MSQQPEASYLPPEAKNGERDGSDPRWVRLSDLPPLPLHRVSKSQVISSSHRYQGPISSLKLKVRLLEYDSLRKKGDALSVFEDRIFTWQEKVDWGGDSGSQLHSYVDADSVTVKKLPTVIQKKAASTITRKAEELEEWEDVEVDQIGSNSKDAKMPSQDSDEKTKKANQQVLHGNKHELTEQQLLLRTLQKHQEDEQRQAILDDLLRHDTVSTQGLLSKHLRSKRPITSVSTCLLPDARADGRKLSWENEQLVKSNRLLLPFNRRTRAVEERSQRRQMSLPSQSMLILVTIPECVRNLVVCRIKVLPTAGIVNIKAPFGFRIIHAAKTRVFRLSWELHLPEDKKMYPPEERNRQCFIPTRNSWSDVSFKAAELNEIRIFLMGEILTAQGFETEPLCVNFLLETEQGWTNHSSSQGTTHSSYTTHEGCAHFSHHFSAELSFSADAIQHAHQTAKSPQLLVLVLSLKEGGGVRYEGYGFLNIPFTPGPHTLKIITWKLCHRTMVDKLQDIFMDATPSLCVKPAHFSSDRFFVGNKLGLATMPSGEVVIRLHLTHLVPTSIQDQVPKLELLEKMSSATIIKSVQKVIDAFNRARYKSPTI